MSAAAVVAGFMGGMGLGAWLYNHLHSRPRRPLLDYAALGVLVAGLWLIDWLGVDEIRRDYPRSRDKGEINFDD